MKRSILLVLAFIAVLFQPLFSGPLEEGWKLAKQGDGITVYTRPIPGSPHDEFMGVADVNAPIGVATEVIKDYSSFPGWFGFCRDIRLVKDFSEEHKIVYFILATPIIKDRDVVLDVVLDDRRGEGRSVFTIRKEKDDLVPDKGRYVRMSRLESRFVLTRVNDTTTRVVYSVISDPGGSIPKMVSNILAKDQPYLTLKGLKEMSKKDQYYEKAGMRKQG